MKKLMLTTLVSAALAAAAAAEDPALPERLKTLLDGRRGAFTYGGRRKARALLNEEDRDWKEVFHPMIRTHSETGRKSLYFDPGKIVYIEGLERQQSDDLIEELTSARAPRSRGSLSDEAVISGLYFSPLHRENFAALCDDKHPFRLYAGYAGWGNGQLDRELSVGGWLILEASPADAFSDRDADQWNSARCRVGDAILWETLRLKQPPNPEAN